MSTFVKGGSTGTPFGKNEYLRSTRDCKFESFTVAGGTVPSRTIDGVAGQKILQPGTVMAKITSTADAGKIGPYISGGSAGDGRETITNIVGILDTFLPWQTIERDVEVAVMYEGTVVQAWCLELTSASLVVPVALSTATAKAMQQQSATNANNIGVNINFR
jgi:hypothetical protein